MNIASLLSKAARTWRDDPAIAWIDGVVLTYGELQDRAARLAAGLRARGLKPGDRVSLAMANTPTYYEVLFACWIAGLVAAPLNCRLHPREMRIAAEDCAASLCFATPELTGPLQAALAGLCPVVEVEDAAFEALHAPEPMAAHAARPGEPAWLFYTSGTTGRPKGAIHTHRTLWNTVLNFLADSGVVSDDHILHLAPLSHASGFLGLAYLSRGRTNVILPTGGLDPVALAAALGAFPPLSFFAVPTLVRRLMDPAMLDPALLPRIRRIFFGGAPMYVEDLKRAIQVFGTDRLWHLYGQGECPNTITHLPPRLFPGPGDPDAEARLASVGVARSGVEVRVRGEDGRDLPPGQVGEVVVQGDNLMAGYWGNPEATAAAIRDGWLRTGDLGRLDERGFLTLVDRAKDVIISGGSNIYPREIEEVLLTHPAVAECAVVGAPDPDWGEVPVAFLVADPAPAPADLEALCLANLARYKRPRRYVFLPELPKSSYGKVLKRELREPGA